MKANLDKARAEYAIQVQSTTEKQDAATQAEARLELATQNLEEVRTALNQEQPLLESERQALADVQRQLVEQQAEVDGNLKLYQELLSEIKIKELRVQDLDTAIDSATQRGEGN